MAYKLLETGHAYRCFCTPERLEQMRESQAAAKQAPMYDRTCANLSSAEIEEKLAQKIPYTIRLKIPYDDPIRFQDLVRGKMSFDPKLIDDQILLKSDGFPTYHLANVIDDHDMQITHVIRGEEWLPSTPKHLILYKAFGFEPPHFAHLPLILNKDRSKLSKRQNDVNVESYLEKGFSKEAILNFIALLGWHPGQGEKQEIFTLEELIQKFSLDKVHKGGAIFDIEKFNWFNWQWRKLNFQKLLKSQAKSLDESVIINEQKKDNLIFIFKNPEHQTKFNQIREMELLKLCENHLNPDFLMQKDLLLRALLTVEDKILQNPHEANSYISFFFQIPDYKTELLLNEKMQVDTQIAEQALKLSLILLTETPEDKFQQPAFLQNEFIQAIQEANLKNGQVLWPARVALTGSQFSPGVFESCFALQKKEAVLRLEKALNQLKK
jgi:glutamyl/glutaminyl-tRNA synthetase